MFWKSVPWVFVSVLLFFLVVMILSAAYEFKSGKANARSVCWKIFRSFIFGFLVALFALGGWLGPSGYIQRVVNRGYNDLAIDLLMYEINTHSDTFFSHGSGLHSFVNEIAIINTPKSTEALIQLLKYYKSENAPYVRMYAAENLANKKASEALPDLRRAVAKEKVAFVREAMEETIAKLEKDSDNESVSRQSTF